MGLSGQPFVGPDIGGFSGNATPELFARWMGVGALLPFARAHTIKESKDHEPWSFGPECETTCRLALQRRYRLLPYLYTLFWEASRTGLPIARPVFFADPRDAALREVDDCFLLGADLLVRCGVTPDQRRSPSPMPPGTWRAWDPCPRSDGHTDPDLPELLFRGGSIVPLGPAVEFADEKPLDPLTLVVTPDADLNASGVLYEDAGEGLEYHDGIFRLSTYRAQREDGHLVVTRADVRGRLHEHADKHHRHAHQRGLEVVVLLPDGTRVARRMDGEAVRVRV
jgi:alpha-glucosidase